jgi:hypothetical protein
MSATLAKRPSEIKVNILALQDWLGKYQGLVSEHQGIGSNTMRAKRIFEAIEQQIDNAITRVATFTLISIYLNDNTQDKFFKLLDNIIQSLRDFYDAYQEKRYGRLFDIDDFIHTCRADRYFAQLNSLFTEASAIAARIIIQKLS